MFVDILYYLKSGISPRAECQLHLGVSSMYSKHKTINQSDIAIQ